VSPQRIEGPVPVFAAMGIGGWALTWMVPTAPVPTTTADAAAIRPSAEVTWAAPGMPPGEGEGAEPDQWTADQPQSSDRT